MTNDTPNTPTSIPDNVTEAATGPHTPAQDLYRHVNGDWLASHEIPADRSVDGTFHGLRDQAEKDVRAIVESADGRIGDLYSSFMDEAGIDNAGLTPLNKDLDAIQHSSSLPELATALGRLDRTGVMGPVGYWIEKDANGTLNQLYLVQSGLGLPDEAYYREDQHADTRATYVTFIEDMFDLASEQPRPGRFASASAADAARAVMDFETLLAKGHWDNVSNRDADKTYNPTPITDLPTGFPLATWLEATGVSADHGDIIVFQPSYLDHLSTLAADSAVDLDTWKLWAYWRVLTSRASLLPQAIAHRSWEFYSQALSGATEQRARWKRGVGLVESQIGEEVGKLFVAEHFPPSHKEAMLELVDYLTAAYRERIEQLSWMTSATREKALAKLDKFSAKIGYPDKWRNFDELSFASTGAELLNNVRRATAFNHDYEVGKLGKPSDPDEWFATPQTVNAFYNPVKNDITFPAAILREPFFDPAADVAANFGAIGAVIGHEIGHGFDDQGSKYDGDGNLNSWWTDEDRAAFTKLTDKLVAQFDGLVPTGLRQRGITDHKVNGEFTLGENIGDLGGLGIAIVALRRYVDANGGDFTAALPQVFLQWARIWQTAIRPQMAAQYVSIDPHSPAEFRCNVVSSNISEFYDAFDVTPEDDMWLAEEDRVQIW